MTIPIIVKLCVHHSSFLSPPIKRTHQLRPSYPFSSLQVLNTMTKPSNISFNLTVLVYISAWSLLTWPRVSCHCIQKCRWQVQLQYNRLCHTLGNLQLHYQRVHPPLPIYSPSTQTWPCAQTCFDLQFLVSSMQYTTTSSSMRWKLCYWWCDSSLTTSRLSWQV